MPTWQDPNDDEIRYFNNFLDVADQRVLEIGVGDGRLTWRYAAQARRVTGIDPLYDDVETARQERPPALPVDLAIARGEALPFRRDVFDRAVLSWSL